MVKRATMLLYRVTAKVIYSLSPCSVRFMKDWRWLWNLSFFKATKTWKSRSQQVSMILTKRAHLPNNSKQRKAALCQFSSKTSEKRWDSVWHRVWLCWIHWADSLVGIKGKQEHKELSSLPRTSKKRKKHGCPATLMNRASDLGSALLRDASGPIRKTAKSKRSQRAAYLVGISCKKSSLIST